jgi:uncharacterized protein YegL
MPISETPNGASSDSGAIEYISEQHVACVLLLDTSGSMAGDAIRKLNEGIRLFKEQTLKDSDKVVRGCIDVALVTFGQEVVVRQDFLPVPRMETPELSAGGNTPMGEALNKALDMITERKKLYDKHSVPRWRPWIFCITDGEPTDDWQSAAQRLKQMEREKRVVGYCVGVEGYNHDTMSQIFDQKQKRIFKLEGRDFTGLFEFLSKSLSGLQTSQDGTNTVDAPETLHLTMGAGD